MHRPIASLTISVDFNQLYDSDMISILYNMSHDTFVDQNPNVVPDYLLTSHWLMVAGYQINTTHSNLTQLNG